jgi:hypothetical protein
VYADRYFEIGSTHTVCEDYALAGTEDGLSWAILSDGCSSAKNTDVGARLLAHIGKEALQHLHAQGKLFDSSFLSEEFPMLLRNYIIARALEVKSALRLDYDSFSATLLLAFVSQAENGPGMWGTVAFGDGSVVFKRSETEMHRARMHYETNAPYYLSYGMSHENDAAYRQCFGRDKRLNVLHDLDWTPSDVESNDPYLPWSFRLCGPVAGDKAPAQIILFSDGLESYENKDRSVPFNTDDALRSMIGYKGLAGEFVQRRMRAFRKECEKAGVSHYDDVSCAAITLEG